MWVCTYKYKFRYRYIVFLRTDPSNYAPDGRITKNKTEYKT